MAGKALLLLRPEFPKQYQTRGTRPLESNPSLLLAGWRDEYPAKHVFVFLGWLFLPPKPGQPFESRV